MIDRSVRNGALLLLVWVLLWSGDALWGESTWFFHDLRHHHYPWRAWAARTWSAGEVPLWAPVAHGYPLMADGQAGVLYPPNFVLYRLLSEPMAFNWSVVLHHLWAAWGGMWLARVLGRSASAATLAGVAYGFSGFLISHLVYLGMFQVIAWAPWMVGAAVMAVRIGGGWWGLAGLAMGFAWLAGHPQLALYASYAALFVASWDAAERRDWRSLGALAVVPVLAGLVALPQLAATWELVRFGQRSGGVDASFAALGSLPPEELVNAVLPQLFGEERPADVAITYHHKLAGYVGRGVSFWEDCFYLGIPTVILAVAAGRARRAWPWWVLVAFGVILALGATTPLYGLIRWLPGMGWFRFPVRGLFFVTLAASQLGAIGVDRLGGWLVAVPERVRHRALAVAVAVGIAVAAIGGAHALLEARRDAIQAGLAAMVHLEAGEGPEDARDRAHAFVTTLSARTRPWGPYVLWPTSLALATAALFWAAARDRMTPATPTRVVPGLVALDLFVFGIDFNPRTPVDQVVERPEAALVLLGQPGPFRTTVVDRRVRSALDHELMSANLGLLWGVEDVIVPSPLRLVRNEAWLERAGLDLGLASGDDVAARFAANRVLADVAGVRYVTTARTLDLPGLRLVREEAVGERAVRLYENERALPRAFAVGCTRRPDGTALDAVAALDDPAGVAIVEGEGLATCAPGAVGEVTVERTRQAALVVQADLPREAWLVVTETLYPGLAVVVDGQPVEPVRTNDLFLGVPLAAGTHTVVVAYAPGWLYACIGLSCLVVGITAGWSIRRLPPA